MSRYTHANSPKGPVIDRRIFLVLAGVVASGCAVAGVKVLVDGKSAESIDVLASDAVSGDLLDSIIEELGALFRDVNLSVLSDSEMDGRLSSMASGSRPWLVIGADEERVNAFSDLDCRDWADMAASLQESLAFSLGSPFLSAFPMEGDVGLLLCNKELLDSAGVGTTSNVDDFASICTCLSDSDVEPLALEKVNADSSSLSICLDASLAYWSSAEGAEPESLDEAVAILAANALRCGKREDGSAPFETREDALNAFKEGRAAMVFASSTEAAALGDIDFSCLCVPIPTVSDDAPPALRPTRSVVCSSMLDEDACTAVLECLQRAGGVGASGTLAPFRNESGGLTVVDLPETATLSIMPPVLLDSNVLDDQERQGYQERIVTLWSQADNESITYEDGAEVDV